MLLVVKTQYKNGSDLMSQVTDGHPAVCQKQTTSDRYEPAKTDGVPLEPLWVSLQNAAVVCSPPPLNRCQIIDASASSRVRFQNADITFSQRFMKRQ